MAIHYEIREKANYINRERPSVFYMAAISFKCISRRHPTNHMTHNISITEKGSSSSQEDTINNPKEIKPQFNPSMKFHRDVYKIPIHRFRKK